MLLKDVRDFIAMLGIVEDSHCYSGKMINKNDKSIGIYHLKSNRQPNIPIGGINNSSYGIKGISILIHWTEDQIETEKAANKLLNLLLSIKNVTINQSTVKFILPSYDEPIPVDTDDNGIYEYVIECLFFYERK
ncbi:MAG: hypothetical protein K2M73_10470 [Lachnospiraceae bacterium]|nr:hypothetical protein [Lachnospiraceae bacterium]